MKLNFLLSAIAVFCSVVAFASDDLEQRFLRVRNVKDDVMTSIKVTFHAKADDEGSDPLEMWRAETKENVKLKDAFVRVDFSLSPEKGSDVRCRAELPLPERWDGRMWGQGNSGRAGTIRALVGYVAAGTAAVTTDLGTSSVAGSGVQIGDITWPPAVLRDFHWRATHLMTVYGKRIVEAFYGRPPDKAYFAGGSTGGRQAMSEAIRYPEDYDGLLISLPDNNAAANEIAAWHLRRQTHDAEGRLLFTTNEMRVLADAAVEYRAKCDSKPYAGKVLADARFDEKEVDGFLELAAKKLPSLAEGDKLRRLRSLYVPLVHDGKCYFNGYAPGSYLGRNMEWYGLVSLRQYMMEKGVPAAKWTNVGWSEIDMYLRERAPELNACSPNLDAFKARGGKIIMSLGWEDQTVPPNPIIDYYERVCERYGGIDAVKGWFRLFCIPGCAHGGGKGRIMTGTPSGGSARRLLIAWREKGIAPSALQAGWKKKKLDMPIAAYPGVYAKDESGKWRVTEAKRGVPQLDGVVRTTAKGMSPSSAVPADGADGCTAFVVGRKASATGRVIVGHNNDGFGPMKYAILPATDSAPALEEPGRAGGLGGGKSPVLYWQAVYSDKARSGKATGDVLLNEHGVMAFPNILPVGRILPGDVVSEGIAGRRESFDFAAAYQGVRTKHDPSQRHRIVEFYREAAGVAVNERELPWSVRPAHLVTVDDLKRGFSSHAVGQGRVSVHPEEVPGVAWPVCRLKTLESVICRFAENPADTAIYLAPGRPCETRYDEFRPFRDAPPPYFATGAAAEALLSSRFVQTSAWRESR